MYFRDITNVYTEYDVQFDRQDRTFPSNGSNS